MRHLALLLLFFCVSISHGQASGYSGREEALGGVASKDADERAVAIAWFATHGTQEDARLLKERLTDDSLHVRNVAEQGLWTLWSRSGDDAIDALLARGVGEMRRGSLEAATTTFSEVIRQKPDFAEGWNKRATVLFLAGEFMRSLADCHEVMKRNPFHFGALAGYGQIYFQLEQYERAIEYWNRALEVNPNMAGVQVNVEAAEQLINERRRRSAT